MTFTKEQINMLLSFENGGYTTEFTQEQWSVFCYLDSLGLLQPRYDIEEGLVYLTEKGKVELVEFRKELQALEDAACKDTENKRQQRLQNKIAIANLFVPFIIFALGVISERFVKIYDFVVGFFKFIH